MVQPLIFTGYPRPRRRIRTPSGQVVHLHSLSAARKAYPDPGWSSRSSSLAVRFQEGVSGPRVVKSFIFTRCPLPRRRIRTPSGQVVHLHSLSAARKAYPDPGWSSRSSSLAVRLQEGVSGPRVVQPFIFTRCPLPGRRIQTPDGPAVHLRYPLSLSAIRCQVGVSGPPVVQVFIFTRYPPPRRRIRTPSGAAVHLHSLSASRWAYPDREWSSRSSSLAIRGQEGVSGPRVAQPFIFTRYPLPGGRIRTASGLGVHFHSLSAAKKAYPDPEWSRCSSSLVYPPPGRCIRSRGANRSSYLAYPPFGGRMRIADGPVVLVSSPICHQVAVSGSHMRSAVRRNSPLNRQGSVFGPRGCSSRAPHSPICRQRGVSGPREGEPLNSTRLSAPR